MSDRKERHKWSPTEDGVLISAWLNTSKDAVVENEQKASTFWKRIAAYYTASPKLDGLQPRETTTVNQGGGKSMKPCVSLLGAMKLQRNRDRVDRTRMTS